MCNCNPLYFELAGKWVRKAMKKYLDREILPVSSIKWILALLLDCITFNIDSKEWRILGVKSPNFWTKKRIAKKFCSDFFSRPPTITREFSIWRLSFNVLPSPSMIGTVSVSSFLDGFPYSLLWPFSENIHTLLFSKSDKILNFLKILN